LGARDPLRGAAIEPRRSTRDPLAGGMTITPTRRWLGGGVPLIGAFLLVIVAVGWWALNPWLGKFLFAKLEGPRLQRDLSFRAAWVTRPAAGRYGPFEVYTLTDVDPKGKLGLAGFKAGDIPLGYQHGFESGFLSDLKAWEDGEAVSVQVVSGDEIYMEPHPLRTIQLSPAVQ